MNQRIDFSETKEAMSAVTVALEYSRRPFADHGFVTYNHDEAIRLGEAAMQSLDSMPDDFTYSTWHMSKHADPKMMEVDPDSFYQIKEHMSERASEESILKQSPLELWADHIKWWK